MHVIFDGEFSTLSYLTSNEAPPNWQQLFANITEKATEDQIQLSHASLHSSPDPLSNIMSSLTEGASNTSPTLPNTMTPVYEGATSNDPPMPPLANRPPDDNNENDDDNDNVSVINQSSGEDTIRNSPFVDIATLGL